MSDDARALITTAIEDLRYILKDWDDQIDDPALRRGSVTLRRLLVDGDLQRAWNLLGLDKEPRFDAPTLAPILSTQSLKHLVFASAGGAHYGGGSVQGVVAGRGRPRPMPPPGKDPPLERLGLQKFAQATAMVADGELISRRLVIKYIANKLGGAHFNAGRDPTKREDALFSKLDVLAAQYQIMGKNAVYFELLSIGQVFSRARDIELFCRKAELYLAAGAPN